MRENGRAMPVSLNSPNRKVRRRARYSLVKVHQARVKALTGTMLSTSRMSSWSRRRRQGQEEESKGDDGGERERGSVRVKRKLRRMDKRR